MTLIKIHPDPRAIPVQVPIVFTTPRGISYEAARVLVPFQMHKVAKHLKSQGYTDWMGSLGYGKPYSEIHLDGPFIPIGNPVCGEVEGGQRILGSDRWEWRIRAFYLHKEQRFTFEEEEIDAVRANILRDFDRMDGLL